MLRPRRAALAAAALLARLLVLAPLAAAARHCGAAPRLLVNASGDPRTAGGLLPPVALGRDAAAAAAAAAAGPLAALFAAYDAATGAERLWRVDLAAPSASPSSSPPPTPVLVAEAGAPIPGTDGRQTFTGFTDLGGTHRRPVFLGEGDGAWGNHTKFLGVYIGPPPLRKVVDTTDWMPRRSAAASSPPSTAAPAATRFRELCCPSVVPDGSGNVLFAGADSYGILPVRGGTEGIYLWNASTGTLSIVTDTHLSGLPHVSHGTRMAAGRRVLFFSNAPPGIYAANVSHDDDDDDDDDDDATRNNGDDEAVWPVAGLHTRVPQRQRWLPAQNFRAFGDPVAAGPRGAFLGMGDAGLLGLYWVNLTRPSLVPPLVDILRVVADNTMPFGSFPEPPLVSDDADGVVFYAEGEYTGLYLWGPSTGYAPKPFATLESTGLFALSAHSKGFAGGCVVYSGAAAGGGPLGIWAVDPVMAAAAFRPPASPVADITAAEIWELDEMTAARIGHAVPTGTLTPDDLLGLNLPVWARAVVQRSMDAVRALGGSDPRAVQRRVGSAVDADLTVQVCARPACSLNLTSTEDHNRFLDLRLTTGSTSGDVVVRLVVAEDARKAVNAPLSFGVLISAVRVAGVERQDARLVGQHRAPAAAVLELDALRVPWAYGALVHAVVQTTKGWRWAPCTNRSARAADDTGGASYENAIQSALAALVPLGWAVGFDETPLTGTDGIAFQVQYSLCGHLMWVPVTTQSPNASRQAVEIPSTNQSLVAASSCAKVSKSFCYEGTPATIANVVARDPLCCKPPADATVLNASCASQNFTKFFRYDPIFRNAALWCRSDNLVCKL